MKPILYLIFQQSLVKKQPRPLALALQVTLVFTLGIIPVTSELRSVAPSLSRREVIVNVLTVHFQSFLLHLSAPQDIPVVQKSRKVKKLGDSQRHQAEHYLHV